MFKKLATIILIVLCCVGLLSCGRPKDDRLRVMIWGGPEEVSTVRAYLEAYRQQHSGFTYTLLSYPATIYYDHLQLMLLKNQPPDLLYMGREWLAYYASNQLLADAGTFINNDSTFDTGDFFPELLDAFRYQGNLYGIAKDFSTLVLYYNQDLFDQAGLSYPTREWTWDDFLAAAKKLTRDTDNDGAIDQYGFALETWLLELAPWLWQNGVEITENNQWVMGTDKYRQKSIATMQLLIDMMTRQPIAPTMKTMDQFGGGGQLFMSGKAAMCTYGRWACLQFKNINRFKWGIAHLPAGRDKIRATPLFTVSWSITEKSEKKQLAWDVLKYLVSVEVQTNVAVSGLAVPVRRSVASSSHFSSGAGLPADIKQEVFLESLEYARFLQTPPQWMDISSAIDKEFEPVFRENRPVAAAIDDLQKRVDNILK